jgi:2-keto-4-pentenoate hydratase/2-oxohepta-3-ene-1,7-dioic acid hydratase in catechol pathway
VDLEPGKAGDLSSLTTANGTYRTDTHIPMLIATISAGLTLQPGDIIATGTPKGVGIGF